MGTYYNLKFPIQGETPHGTHIKCTFRNKKKSHTIDWSWLASGSYGSEDHLELYPSSNMCDFISPFGAYGAIVSERFIRLLTQLNLPTFSVKPLKILYKKEFFQYYFFKVDFEYLKNIDFKKSFFVHDASGVEGTSAVFKDIEVVQFENEKEFYQFAKKIDSFDGFHSVRFDTLYIPINYDVLTFSTNFLCSETLRLLLIEEGITGVITKPIEGFKIITHNRE